ncbi:MAG: molybdopterin-synthase adenylyltransferase MoeB [Proteobacteria bacterium]|nr:molybdopterin-synthase adenylyltransferase MoeB [Pseudomonadota bacterium]
MPFNHDEQQRYARHFSLAEIGIEGQQRLKNAKVLCVGAGGLGSPLLLYLAAAGVGTIGIIDFDTLDLSNLQRQILYDVTQIGLPKTEAAKQRLLNLNPHIEIITYPERLTENNVLDIVREYDIVADGSDNFTTRYLVNDACFHLQKPNVQASIFQFSGQCSVFTTVGGPCYRCLFPHPPTENFIPNCSETGVLGVLPGIMGSIQATEVIKLICGIGMPLVGRLLSFDALQMKFHELKLPLNPNCDLCIKKTAFEQLQRSSINCQLNQETNMEVKEITVQELHQWSDAKKKFFLLDVRNPDEFEAANLNGCLIPLKELPQRFNELNKEEEIVVHCKSGGRSRQAVEFLMQQGFSNVCNLQGGILAWLKEFGSERPK